jgi:tryptophan synthase alpha chain
MINSNITLAFENCKLEKRPALLTYIVAGDNNKKMTLNILKSISPYVDICEIGMPHNTAVADGKQIQNSSYRALKNGIKLNDVFDIVKEFKKSDNAKPTILMGYYNQIIQYGESEFIKKCKNVGVDGLIVVDLPFPENKQFSDKCKKNHINFVQLIAPTTSNERMKKIIKSSHDMIYYISMLSTTGGKLKVSPKKILENYFKIKRINKNKNIVIGFGITEKTIKSLRQADGLVVGSQLCKGIGDSLMAHRDPVKKLNKIVKSLRSKIQ